MGWLRYIYNGLWGFRKKVFRISSSVSGVHSRLHLLNANVKKIQDDIDIIKSHLYRTSESGETLHKNTQIALYNFREEYNKHHERMSKTLAIGGDWAEKATDMLTSMSKRLPGETAQRAVRLTKSGKPDKRYRVRA